MNWLTLWLEHKTLIAEQKSHGNGFDWAAGELLRGRDPDSIERQLDWMHPCSFDEGVMDALRTAQRKSYP